VAVRTWARKLLKGSGYTVLDAPDGETGLRLATSRGDLIHLLVTDVVMPGMDGLSKLFTRDELLSRARAVLDRS
jgi:DNA-binding response OmpR family regulator